MKKAIIKGVLIFGVIVVIIGAITDGGKKLDGPTPNSETSPSPTNQPSVAPTIAQLTPEAKIEKIVKDGLLSSKKLREVKVTTESDEKYGVKVSLNGSENISSNLTQLGIKKDVSSVFYSLYKEGLGIEYAVVTSYYPTTDKYGNKSEAIIYQARLIASEASKVNWSQDKSMLLGTTLQAIWAVEVDKLNQL